MPCHAQIFVAISWFERDLKQQEIVNKNFILTEKSFVTRVSGPNDIFRSLHQFHIYCVIGSYPIETIVDFIRYLFQDNSDKTKYTLQIIFWIAHYDPKSLVSAPLKLVGPRFLDM